MRISDWSSDVVLFRSQDSNDALRGLGDIDAGLDLGAFVNYRAGPWSAGLTVFRDVSDAYDGGMTAQLKGGYMYPISQRLRLRTEVSTAWADDNYTEAFRSEERRVGKECASKCRSRW